MGQYTDRAEDYEVLQGESIADRVPFLNALGRYIKSLPGEVDQFQTDVAENPLGTLKGIGLGALQSVPTPPSKYLKKLQEMPEYEEMSPQAQGGVELGEDIGKAAQSQAINAMVPGGTLLGNVTGSVLSEIPYMADQTPGESMGSMGMDMALSTILGRLAQSPGVKRAIAQGVADETGALGFGPTTLKNRVKALSATPNTPLLKPGEPHNITGRIMEEAKKKWNSGDIQGALKEVEGSFGLKHPDMDEIENFYVSAVNSIPQNELPLYVGIGNEFFAQLLEQRIKSIK